MVSTSSKNSTGFGKIPLDFHIEGASTTNQPGFTADFWNGARNNRWRDDPLLSEKWSCRTGRPSPQNGAATVGWCEFFRSWHVVALKITAHQNTQTIAPMSCDLLTWVRPLASYVPICSMCLSIFVTNTRSWPRLEAWRFRRKTHHFGCLQWHVLAPLRRFFSFLDGCRWVCCWGSHMGTLCECQGMAVGVCTRVHVGLLNMAKVCWTYRGMVETYYYNIWELGNKHSLASHFHTSDFGIYIGAPSWPWVWPGWASLAARPLMLHAVLKRALIMKRASRCDPWR